MRRDAVLVDEPEQGFGIRHQWIVDNPILLRDLDALEPLRESFRYILLNESLSCDAGGIAFHRDRAADDMRQHHRRDHLVIAGKFTFCDASVWKQDFVRMCDHHVSLTTSRADLSSRI